MTLPNGIYHYFDYIMLRRKKSPFWIGPMQNMHLRILLTCASLYGNKLATPQWNDNWMLLFLDWTVQPTRLHFLSNPFSCRKSASLYVFSCRQSPHGRHLQTCESCTPCPHSTLMCKRKLFNSRSPLWVRWIKVSSTTCPLPKGHQRRRYCVKTLRHTNQKILAKTSEIDFSFP